MVNFGLILELACAVAYLVILIGGRAIRESGWKILAGLLLLVAAAELIAMALVVRISKFGLEYERANSLQAYLFDHDNRFFVGWELDKSWVLCTVSWIVLLLDALGLIGAALFLPSEDGYEPIPEPR